MRLGEITHHSARALGLSRSQIRFGGPKRRLAYPRQIVMATCRAYSSESLPKIGRHLGGRHHTTIMHGIEQVEARCAADPAYARLVSQVCALVEIEINAARIRHLNAPPPMGPLALLMPMTPQHMRPLALLLPPPTEEPTVDRPLPLVTPCAPRRIMVAG